MGPSYVIRPRASMQSVCYATEDNCSGFQSTAGGPTSMRTSHVR